MVVLQWPSPGVGAAEAALAAAEQISWLAGVLAIRGMPSLLLERHLAHLDALVGSTDPTLWTSLRAHGQDMRHAAGRSSTRGW